MTDRYHALTVVLKNDIREDDAKGLIEAIKLLKNVVAVRGVVRDPDAYVAQERVREKFIRRINKVLYTEEAP